MRKLFSLTMIVLLTLGLFFQTAEAKRFGGGRSFGMQRSSSSYSRSQSAPLAPQAANTASGASKWLGPLAGLAAGGLLASLFMGHGIASGILSWLLIGGAALLLINFLRRRVQPVTQPTTYQRAMHDNVAAFTPRQAYASSSPAGFDSNTFLRDAKVQFIRLQAAYDAKNTNDLREFTSPEVFGEIQMQFQERGDALNQTDVVSLDAELLDATNENQHMLATVRFSGLIREEANAAPISFNEIWHFRKDITKSIWMVAGIQQEA